MGNDVEPVKIEFSPEFRVAMGEFLSSMQTAAESLFHAVAMSFPNGTDQMRDAVIASVPRRPYVTPLCNCAEYEDGPSRGEYDQIWFCPVHGHMSLISHMKARERIEERLRAMEEEDAEQSDAGADASGPA